MKKADNKLDGGLSRKMVISFETKETKIIIDQKKVEEFISLKETLDTIDKDFIVPCYFYGIKCVAVFDGTESYLFMSEFPPMEVEARMEKSSYGRSIAQIRAALGDCI